MNDQEKIAKGIIPKGTKVTFSDVAGRFTMHLEYPDGQKRDVTKEDECPNDGSADNGKK